MTQVPRHVLIPRAYQRLGSERPVRRWRLLDAIGDLAALLELIYSTDQVVVRIGGVRPEEQSVGAECTGAPTAMSSGAGLLAVALQDLRLEPGDRFLEVGACTGYLCALAAWLTGRQVTGVEIDWSLVRETGPRLAQAGADVWLLARDAERGLPDGTWDKITASFAVPSIPASWLHRLAPGGRLRTTINGGAPGWHATALVQRGIAGALTGTLTAELWGHVPSRRVGWLPVPSPPDGPGRTRCAVLPPPAHTARLLGGGGPSAARGAALLGSGRQRRGGPRRG
ncbi:protein-L-isoaspartate O-methyltransferase [Kitasatospora sp. NPDC088160]|uniref:protein-L-isoaspartate O-methyltransferase family protein n=1 Tax=Kitasatospora sp. NPDC088160 TaxID=3364072 RepID=UPI00381E11CD